MKISILIPTLNNTELLKLIIPAFREYTTSDLEILVFANQMDASMKEYRKTAEVDRFLSSQVNLGVAKPTNELFKVSTGDIILYCNDDMFPVPDWDTPLIKKFDDSIFFQYITPIMFNRTHVPTWHSPFNYGDCAENFQRDRFLKEWVLNRQYTRDIKSAASPPFLKRELWERIKGFDERFYPGFGTDPDMAATIYFMAQKEDVSYEFRGVADSTMYHFYDRGCSKLPNRDVFAVASQNVFQQKWKMSIPEFYKLLNMREYLDET